MVDSLCHHLLSQFLTVNVTQNQPKFSKNSTLKSETFYYAFKKIDCLNLLDEFVCHHLLCQIFKNNFKGIFDPNRGTTAAENMEKLGHS